jgi:hypothetical protein
MKMTLRRFLVSAICLLTVGLSAGQASAYPTVGGVNFTAAVPAYAQYWQPGAYLGKPWDSATNVGTNPLWVQTVVPFGSGSNQYWNVYGTLSSATTCYGYTYQNNGTFLGGSSDSGNGFYAEGYVAGILSGAGTHLTIICNVAPGDTITSAFVP